MPNGVIAHEPSGKFDVEKLKKEAREWSGLVGMDLVPKVTSGQRFTWDETPWDWEKGYGKQSKPEFHVVAIDYGIKRNILRLLAGVGCKVTVVPASTGADEIMALKPDGVFLSNGPGDPAATRYGVAAAGGLLGRVPLFGICLGYQLLALALGGRTFKMRFGHRGANQPVRDVRTGRVEVTSHNHGFAVDPDGWPREGGVVHTDHGRAELTHWALNDGTLEGLRCLDVPALGVQYHPEAAPGPHDARHLFAEFRASMEGR
jgi:carbamoyl-phosphate synthase small subunit